MLHISQLVHPSKTTHRLFSILDIKPIAMPMPHCSQYNPYQNLFLTVPDRGFSKQELLKFIKAWRDDYDFCEIAREPYAKPEAGWTHHYHVGLCFPNESA